jgi:hypothetical protein
MIGYEMITLNDGHDPVYGDSDFCTRWGRENDGLPVE